MPLNFILQLRWPKGISYLATSNCELFLLLFKHSSPIEDIVKALCRRAYIVGFKESEYT